MGILTFEDLGDPFSKIPFIVSLYTISNLKQLLLVSKIKVPGNVSEWNNQIPSGRFKTFEKIERKYTFVMWCGFVTGSKLPLLAQVGGGRI